MRHFGIAPAVCGARTILDRIAKPEGVVRRRDHPLEFGTTAVGHWGPDYGVIVLDPAKVTPVASLGGITVTDIGTGSVG